MRHSRKALCALLAVAAGALGACASPNLPGPTAAGGLPGVASDRLPARAEVTEVPFFPQTGNDCGPAALAMVLGWSGGAARPEGVAVQVR
jgi:hypothetical protein